MIKARAYSKLSGYITLADDSGLCVASLGGAPGVVSARYAGPGCTYDDNNRKLLGALAGKSRGARRAYFQCTVALFRRGKRIRVLNGKVWGTITSGVRGKNGFGYDPVFVPDGTRRTFAEMPGRVKDRISHRGRALAVTTRFLERYFSRLEAEK